MFLVVSLTLWCLPGTNPISVVVWFIGSLTVLVLVSATTDSHNIIKMQWEETRVCDQLKNHDNSELARRYGRGSDRKGSLSLSLPPSEILQHLIYTYYLHIVIC